MRSLRASFVVASAALALFGLGRFVFNLLTVRAFGAVFVGNVNVALSSWTVVAVLLGSVPGFLASKFAAESAAKGDIARAGRVTSASLAAACGPGVLVALIATLVSPSHGVWAWYVPVFATYLVAKAAAFALGRQRAYLVSEAVGFGAFITVCGSGLLLGSPRLAAASLIVHPATITSLTLWSLRSHLVMRGLVDEIVSDARAYGRFWAATTINAAAGLVSYHMAVVLAGWILSDRASVGYLSVLLSSLAPLNFFPAALGTSLFPEIARRHGEGDEAGQRAAVSRSVLAVQALVCGAGVLLLLFPEPLLRAMHVPQSVATRSTWILLAWVLQLTIVSSPCGHYLNATRFAAQHAFASLLFLVVGLAAGVAGMAYLGIVGAGVMRIGVDAGLAWTRMTIAERALRWMDRIKGPVFGCQASLTLAMIVGFVAPGWPWRVGCWLLGVASQLPSARALRAGA